MTLAKSICHRARKHQEFSPLPQCSLKIPGVCIVPQPLGQWGGFGILNSPLVHLLWKLPVLLVFVERNQEFGYSEPKLVCSRTKHSGFLWEELIGVNLKSKMKTQGIFWWIPVTTLCLQPHTVSIPLLLFSCPWISGDLYIYNIYLFVLFLLIPSPIPLIELM